MFLDVNGHALYVTCAGPQDGPAIVLLHHGLGSTASWKSVIPALADAGWRVIAYDRWGYGASSPRPGLDIPGFTQDQDDLLVILGQLSIGEAVLVGHSDGGTLALGCAARWPDKVIRLVVVAAHIYIEPCMVAGIEATRQAYNRKEKFWSALTQVHGDLTDQVMMNWVIGWKNPGNLDWDLRPQLSGITCPALVMQGMLDEHATAQQARDLAAALPDASLLLVPDAGHMLPQDAPEIFNAHLLDFLPREVIILGKVGG